MDELFDRLFPICRSITGPGLRETLEILSEFMPLEHFSMKTGTKVFDWTIPEEWHIRGAKLTDPDGKVVVDFKSSNLHVLNYSAPVNQTISFEQLQEHIHTLPHLPQAIPYVTSYYTRRWGFCMAHEQFAQLQPGHYHACIDSEFIDGELNYAHAILPGESDKEILISSYICHPSMANNELSGPIVAAFLHRRLAQWASRRFTYRFVLAPETIGSIAYLSQFGDTLKKNIHSGLVLTCMGGEAPLTYKMSRRENAPVDQAAAHIFRTQTVNGDIRPFTPVHGSDERQYCSPGFNLPVGQMARMVYGAYPAYHNSLDNKETMTIDALAQSVDELEKLLKVIELDGYYVNRFPYGEVKLDRHGLYPDMNSPYGGVFSTNQLHDNRVQLNRILMLLNYADGQHTLMDIADKCGCNILELAPIVELLQEKRLLDGPFAGRTNIE